VVTRTSTGKSYAGTATAQQHFHPIPDSFIEQLIQQGDVLYCSGGFAIELMEPYLKALHGEKETIIGLPKTLTQQLILQALQEK
jgi:septum formation protein